MESRLVQITITAHVTALRTLKLRRQLVASRVDRDRQTTPCVHGRIEVRDVTEVVLSVLLVLGISLTILLIDVVGVSAALFSRDIFSYSASHNISTILIGRPIAIIKQFL